MPLLTSDFTYGSRSPRNHRIGSLFSSVNLPKRPAGRNVVEAPHIKHLEESQDLFDTQAEDSQVTYYNESQFDELDDSQATLVEIS